ncbi:MAG: NAD-dependent epimerase/dehydratase family protein [Myxococcota bacterium]
MKRVLITGGCGFLGSSIVRRVLERKPQEVRVLALPGEPTDNVEGLDVEVVRGDVRNREDCERAVEGIDTMFHPAAIYKAWMPDPTAMYEVNLRGTFNMLEAGRRAGVDTTVFTGSIVAVGRPPHGQLGDEETRYDAWDIDFAYSRTKVLSRWIAEDFARWDMDVRVVCPGVVLGPRDIAPTPSGELIIKTLQQVGPPITVDGGANYVDVRDAAECHVLAAEKGQPGELYMATAHNLTNLELVEKINEVAGVKRRYFKMPVGVARTLVGAMEKQAVRQGKEPDMSKNFFEYSLKPSFFRNDKVLRELGAQFRPIEDTIRDAIEWFRERGMV